MFKSPELPDCFYPNQPTLVRPNSPTPNHSLYLSNLDDQKFLRFSIKYLYLFQIPINSETLKSSLSKVLVHYYTLAGRLRNTSQDDHKLEVDCNGEGAVFVEAFMDITAQEFLEFSRMPNRSWRKLLYRFEALSFLDVPPLIIQVTNLRCGGMILCTAINHCICDGIGTSQFLHAWAHLTAKQNLDPPVPPVHSRHMLKPRSPPHIPFSHPQFTRSNPSSCHVDILKFLQSQPLVPTSFTFTTSTLLHLKRQCIPSLKCTTFEALASHTWRSWIRSLNLSPSLTVKLLFSVNVRNKLSPEIPRGYYGNGFVLGCAEAHVKNLITANLHRAVTAVQQAKSELNDGYVRSMVDLLEDKTVKTDLSVSLVISQWAKLGLEDLDFGAGKPIWMGPVSSDIYCLFLPVVGDVNSVRVQVSVPESVVEKFEYHMINEFFDDKEENGSDVNGFYNKEEENNGLI